MLHNKWNAYDLTQHAKFVQTRMYLLCRQRQRNNTIEVEVKFVPMKGDFHFYRHRKNSFDVLLKKRTISNSVRKENCEDQFKLNAIEVSKATPSLICNTHRYVILYAWGCAASINHVFEVGLLYMQWLKLEKYIWIYSWNTCAPYMRAYLYVPF